MRAQCVEGGTHNTVAGNLARRCDSSVLVEQGATDTVLRRQPGGRLPDRHARLGEHVRICSYRRDDGAIRAGIVDGERGA